MLAEAQDSEEIIQRIAAVDVGKAEVMCCVRIPGERGKRLQEVRPYPTMTRSLLAMADHLRVLGVTRVVMEATSDYWKPIFYVLEAQGFETWLVNAKDVKHLPGRPKTVLRGSASSSETPQPGNGTTSPATASSAPVTPRSRRSRFRGSSRTTSLIG